MRPQRLIDLMMKASDKARSLPPPERYLWIAVWWHLHARESAAPDQCLGYASGQLRLAKDMASRPEHYRKKPAFKTDWEWSDLASPPSSPPQAEATVMTSITENHQGSGK